MPRQTPVARFMVVFAALFCWATMSAIGASPGGASSSQVDAGYLANVKDLHTTVAYSAAENATDVSLGLAPPAPSGAPGVTFIFRARFQGRTVDTDKLTGIIVRAHYRVLSDDRVRSSQALETSYQLHMNLDPGDRSGISLDFFPANWGYYGFTAPGDEIPVAYFTVAPEELRAISLANAVTGEVLWTNFTLTAAELEALRAFARQVLPAVRRRS
jgi:hypothetical protein